MMMKTKLFLKMKKTFKIQTLFPNQQMLLSKTNKRDLKLKC